MRARSWGLALVVVGVVLTLALPGSAAVGQARTEGTKYDRNPSLVRDGGVTYLFFARSQNDCNRLAGCNADGEEYDLYVKASTNEGKDFGPAQLAALNPDSAGIHLGRTVAATRTADGTVYVFWASGGNGTQLFYVRETAPGVFSAPMMPIGLGLDDVINVEALAVGSTIYLYTDEAGGIFARTFDGTTGVVTGGPNLAAPNKNIPKAIVDVNGGFRMTMVDANAFPQVDVYVDSSADGLNWPAAEVLVVSKTGSNWDPNLAQKPNGQYYLHFAPDRGDGRQQIALTKSNDFVKWTTPHDITPGFSGGVEYWDYWPEGFVAGNQVKLFYTSERGFDAHPDGTGHIWSTPGQSGGDPEGK